MDIDEAFDVGRLTSNLRARYGQSEKFGLAFFSGVFYHLKNPYRVLERLRETCHYCLMTTRVFSNLPTDGSDQSATSVSYFLKDRELNNDPTNYFVFTPTGLITMLERTGFEVLAVQRLFNDPANRSDPISMTRIERAFVLLRVT